LAEQIHRELCFHWFSKQKSGFSFYFKNLFQIISLFQKQSFSNLVKFHINAKTCILAETKKIYNQGHVLKHKVEQFQFSHKH